MTFDVAIIGGGIIGMMTAHELSQRGLNCAVIERGSLGQEASSAGGGILSSLSPWYDTLAAQQLYRLSQGIYPSLCQQLEDNTGLETGYRECGILLVEPESNPGFSDWQSSQVDIEFLEHSRLEMQFPHFPESTAACLLPRLAQIENSSLINALKQHLVRDGVTLKEHCPVQDFIINNDDIQAIETESGQITAGSYVLAAGAWSGNTDWGFGIQVRPVRGQMIAYDLPFDACPHIVLWGGRYCIPRSGRRLLVGSTVEEVGFDQAVTAAAREELMRFAVTVYPQLAGIEPSEHWAGLRPRVDRDNPLIGLHPHIGNLYINTGHYRNGLLAAPASAKLLADIMQQQPTELDIAAFLPIKSEMN